ncbi:MAG: hypothetical protein ACRDRS_18950, partial [Pseudonocardiaceae bacterium]
PLLTEPPPMPRDRRPGANNLGEEATQDYAAHSLVPDLTVTTSSAVRPHVLVDAIKPMVSASMDTTRTGPGR